MEHRSLHLCPPSTASGNICNRYRRVSVFFFFFFLTILVFVIVVEKGVGAGKNIFERTMNSTEYSLIFRGLKFYVLHIASVLLLRGASGVDTDGVSLFVMEGDSVTLHTDVSKPQQERIKWYFNDTCVAEMNGDLSKICENDQCHDDKESLRDGISLDHQTGSLTITNIRTTHSGVYKLQIMNNSSSIREKIFSVTVRGESFYEFIKSVYVLICDSHCYFFFQ
uniref:Immunoglobulin domain-containing protein n=1 Tax=Cyprinus carpio TaxID=7962 RepID=A0A8C1PIW5_CYPCA